MPNTVPPAPVNIPVPGTAEKVWAVYFPWLVKAGSVEARGSSKREAVALAAERLAKAAERLALEPIVVMWRGYVSVATPNLDNWTVRTFCPDGRNGGFSGVEDVAPEVMTARLRYELAQRATNWFDDADVREAIEFCAPADGIDHGQYGGKALGQYAAWQRAAHYAIERSAAIRSDEVEPTEADAGIHKYQEWADANQGRFAVPAKDVEPVQYRVIWDIDIDAPNPGQAAQRARAIQADRESLATTFTVEDTKGGKRWVVELDELIPAVTPARE